ncbi:hypothetical protein OFB78_29970, partial [Escherichia coli]|nr:hypothetical protein [Escherichia coli]
EGLGFFQEFYQEAVGDRRGEGVVDDGARGVGADVGGVGDMECCAFPGKELGFLGDNTSTAMVAIAGRRWNGERA